MWRLKYMYATFKVISKINNIVLVSNIVLCLYVIPMVFQFHPTQMCAFE